MSTCSLRINNNSAATLFFFICRSLASGGAVVPVWQTDELPPNGMRHIEWDADDISFAWADMGPIEPDKRFEIGGTLATDGIQKAVLDRVSGDTYTLMPSMDGQAPPAGSYLVTTTNKVPPDQVAIGLTLGENVFEVARTGPNLNIEITLDVDKLALVRSKTLAPVGLMVPRQLLTKAVEIDFRQGSNLVATYQLDDTWTIAPA